MISALSCTYALSFRITGFSPSKRSSTGWNSVLMLDRVGNCTFIFLSWSFPLDFLFVMNDIKAAHLPCVEGVTRPSFEAASAFFRPFSADILHIPSAISFAQILSSRPRWFRQTFMAGSLSCSITCFGQRIRSHLLNLLPLFLLRLAEKSVLWFWEKTVLFGWQSEKCLYNSESEALVWKWGCLGRIYRRLIDYRIPSAVKNETRQFELLQGLPGIRTSEFTPWYWIMQVEIKKWGTPILNISWLRPGWGAIWQLAEAILVRLWRCIARTYSYPKSFLPSSVVLKSPSEMPLISITRAPSATIGYVMPLLRVVFSITRNAGWLKPLSTMQSKSWTTLTLTVNWLLNWVLGFGGKHQKSNRPSWTYLLPTW